MPKTTETTISELEFLASKLEGLREAEDLAEDVDPALYHEIVKLHQEALKQIVSLARRLLRGKIVLGYATKITIEHIERMFAVLRNQAELAQARAAKFTGKRARKAVSEANTFAKLTRQAARILKNAKEHLERRLRRGNRFRTMDSLRRRHVAP